MQSEWGIIYTMREPNSFSKELESWLRSKRPKTFIGLIEVFGEKSFAVLFMVLMSIPALPLPTGGITHVFEVIVMLLALELIIGRTTMWLPKKWGNMTLGAKMQKRALPFIVRRVRWFERFSRPRMVALVNHRMFSILSGVIIFAFTLGAFLAPPFSGLDTLPALGVVILSLGLILDDILIYGLGLLAGASGIALTISLGAVITKTFGELL